ncbi:MAG: chemotaxis protein CheD [Chryseolinea sp.]
MKKRMLNINEVEVHGKPVVYTCYGLGSCIALFITDGRNGLSGGAHIPLPFSLDASDFQDASSMINRLLLAFSAQGSDLNSLSAKVTGGAQIYQSSIGIGQQNVRVVLRKLIKEKIYIAATDVGGAVSRTARFNSITRVLQISTSEKITYCI